MDTYRHFISYRGSTHWKKSRNNEYLYRTVDRLGNGKSLGPRSSETEEIYNKFHEHKKRVSERFKQLKQNIKEQLQMFPPQMIDDFNDSFSPRL